MPTTHECLMWTLRYLPDVVKGEFVNVGVVLLDQGSNVASVRFTHDYRRLRCIDPEVDVRQVHALEILLKARLAQGASVQEMERVSSWAPSAFQLSGVSAVETEDIQAELVKLANLYLKTKRRTIDVKGGRKGSVREQMRSEFESPEFRKLFRWDIAVGDYIPGDPLVIDCGYVADGVLKMFHAAELKTKGEIKNLAFSYPMFSKAFGEESGLKTALTAITPERTDPKIEQFAMSAFQSCHIERVRLKELNALTASIRHDLKL